MSQYATFTDKGNKVAGNPSIKGRLAELEEAISEVNEQIIREKDEVYNMKAARAVKEDEMAKEIGALLAVVITDKARVMSDMEMKFASQKQENTRLQGDIQKLKIVKTSLEGELIDIKRKIDHLELVVGLHDGESDEDM